MTCPCTVKNCAESIQFLLAIFRKIVYTNQAPAGVMELVDVVDSKSTVASLSAACGRTSEGAASAAVGERRRRSRQGEHRAPQTMATYCRLWRPPYKRSSTAVGYLYKRKNTPAGVMELVDVVDSKSTAGDSVPVRVRSPAPDVCTTTQ